MGLRREDTTRLRSSTWSSSSPSAPPARSGSGLVGVAPDLLAAGSPAGRLAAAAVGVASVAAVIRAFVVLGWPVTDNDRSLLLTLGECAGATAFASLRARRRPPQVSSREAGLADRGIGVLDAHDGTGVEIVPRGRCR